MEPLHSGQSLSLGPAARSRMAQTCAALRGLPATLRAAALLCAAYQRTGSALVCDAPAALRTSPASALPLRCSLRTALYSHPVIALSTLYLLRYPTRVPLTLAPLWCTACAMSYVACALRCPRACT